jgi:hypothetical protein
MGSVLSDMLSVSVSAILHAEGTSEAQLIECFRLRDPYAFDRPVGPDSFAHSIPGGLKPRRSEIAVPARANPDRPVTPFLGKDKRLLNPGATECLGG